MLFLVSSTKQVQNKHTHLLSRGLLSISYVLDTSGALGINLQGAQSLSLPSEGLYHCGAPSEQCTGEHSSVLLVAKPLEVQRVLCSSVLCVLVLGMPPDSQ